MDHEQRSPRLDPPGAGVAWWQRLGGKYLLLPAYCRRLTWEGVPDALDAQASRLLGMRGDLGEELLTRRVLVPAQIGLEDSSRFYSYAMVLEHLTVIGGRVAGIVVELSHGRQPPGKVGTAALKPAGNGSSAEAAEGFLEMLGEFRRLTQQESEDRDSGARYDHPWFGPLSAFQWLCFTPFHQSIHLRQAARILDGLPVPR